MISEQLLTKLSNVNHRDRAALDVIVATLVDANIELDSVSLEDVKNMLLQISRARKDDKAKCKTASRTSHVVITCC